MNSLTKQTEAIDVLRSINEHLDTLRKALPGRSVYAGWENVLGVVCIASGVEELLQVNNELEEIATAVRSVGGLYILGSAVGNGDNGFCVHVLALVPVPTALSRYHTSNGLFAS